MSLLEKYLQRDAVHVYEEIANMGSDAFKKKNLIEVRAVLTETMNRVAYNLDVIYTALREINYCFNENPRYDFEHPLLKPRWGTRFRIKKLEKAVLSLGYVPLSVKMFFSIVGSCNFAWDYDTNPDMILLLSIIFGWLSRIADFRGHMRLRIYLISLSIAKK